MLERANELIAKGDPDQRDEEGRTLLMEACNEGNVDVVELLLKNKANPNADFHGYSVFSFVTFSRELKLERNHDKKIKIIKALKEAGAKNKFSLHPIALVKEMKYAKSFRTNFGLCYGIASVGIDYMMRGKKGIEEMDALQFALNHDNANDLAKKIDDIQSERQTYTRENKAKIQAGVENKLREDSNEQDSKLDLTDRNILRLYREISSESSEKDEVIKFHLDQLINFNTEISENERKEIIEWIINDKFHKSIVNNENVKWDEIWRNIRQKMLKKLIDISVQKILDLEIRAMLKEKYKDDAVLLDAPNYLQAVVISQDFLPFDRFFEDMPMKTFVNGNVFVTAPLISSIAVERQGFETSQQYGRLTGNFDKLELSVFFNKCNEYFNQDPKINNPVAFMLSTRTHAISLAYLPDENKWAFNGYSGNRTMFSEDTDKLATEIFANFSAGENLSISCEIYSSKKDGDKVNGVFQKMAEDFIDKIQFTKSRNLKPIYAFLLVTSSILFTCGFILLFFAPLYMGVIGVVGLLGASFGANVSINRLIHDPSIEAQNEFVRAKAKSGGIKQKLNVITLLGIKLTVSIVFLAAAIFFCGVTGLMGLGVVGDIGFNMATLTAGAAAFQALGSMAGSVLGLGTLSTLVATSLATAVTVLGGTLFATMTFFKDFRSLFTNMRGNIPSQAKTSNHSKTIENYTIEMYKQFNNENSNTLKSKSEPKSSTPAAKSQANLFATPAEGKQNSDKAVRNDVTFPVDTNNSTQRKIKK